MRLFLFFFSLMAFLLPLSGQSDELIYSNLRQKYSNSATPTIEAIGLAFLNKPYKKNILETCYPGEELNTSLTSFDCVTFVETVLALKEDFIEKKPSFSNFTNHLIKWRYKQNTVQCSNRLHYFSEWIDYHESRHELRNITKDIGGEIVYKTFEFMSSNRYKYNFLKDEIMFQNIMVCESNLKKIPFYSIPKQNIPIVERKIKTGDIIGITSARSSIDIDHVGFAVVENNEVHLLHASKYLKKVVKTKETLKKYINRHKHHSGIIVLRVN